MPKFALQARQSAHTELVGTLSNIAQKRAGIALLKPPTILVAVVEADEPVRVERIENTPEAKAAIVGRPFEAQDIGINGTVALVDPNAILNGKVMSRMNFDEGEFLMGTFLIVAVDDNGNDTSITAKQLDKIDFKYGPVVGRALLDI
jgi:hypothetical protein